MLKNRGSYNKKSKLDLFQSDESNIKNIGIVSYIFLIALIIFSLSIQSCEIESINDPEEVENEIEKVISLKEEKKEGEDNSNFDGSECEAESNPRFVSVDVSKITPTFDFDSSFESLHECYFEIDSDDNYSISFTGSDNYKMVKISMGINYYFASIDSLGMKAQVLDGDFKGFFILISDHILYLYNDYGAFIFEE
ncbi:MAG: hypothetical protein ACRQFF_04480 [Sphaerochaeta sp.]